MSESADTGDGGSTVSPSDAITDSDVADADAAESGGDSIGLSDMLLSTEPDETPADYSAEDKIAHAIIAVKKMMRGAGAEIQRGTPAVQNLAMSALGFLTGGSSDEDEGTGAVEEGGSI